MGQSRGCLYERTGGEVVGVMTHARPLPPFIPFSRVSRGRKTSLQDGDEIRRLQTAVLRGVFVPVFGAGCSSLGREDHGRAAIAAAMHALEEHAKLDAQERAYLWSVFPPRWKRDPGSATVPEGLALEPLSNLQVALVQLGALAVGLFGKALARKGYSKAVLDANDYEVPLSKDGIAKLCGLLDKAAERAEEFESALQPRATYDDGARPEAQGIRKGLKHLSELFRAPGGVTREYRKATLPIGVLEWLGQLLWYTFRFAIKMLPTTPELAFQIALERSSEMADPTDLATAAELGTYEDVVAKVRRWFEHYEPAAQPASEFYRVMAALLRYLYDHHGSWGLARSSQPSALAATLPGPSAVAFTTNFDGELERAFDSLKAPHRKYHVVFPVYPVSTDGGRSEVLRPAPTWIFRTRNSQSAVPDRVCEAHRPLDRLIEGPIVVKLHGAPLEQPPDPANVVYPPGSTARPTAMQHYLVVAESDYLYDVVANTLPAWLQTSLSSNERSIWFLGHSISDWNIRLRLYGYLGAGQESTAPPDDVREIVGRWALNREFDLFKTAILGSLGIIRVEGDLHKFREEMQNISDERGRILWDYVHG